MQNIAFKSDWKDRESITIWLSPEHKKLYKELRDEYGVRVSEEMRKAISNALVALKEAVTSPAA